MALCMADIFRDDWTSGDVVTIAVRLAVAALLGALVGFERQREGKSAGLRTHMLVSLGAATFVAAPSLGGISDEALSRVIQGVATGVGFLGAGAILKSTDQHQVRGLTTAASIWVTAAVGVAVGAGYLFPAVVAIVLGWFILYPMYLFEERFNTWLGPKPPQDRTGQGE